MYGYSRWWRRRLPSDLVVTSLGLAGLMLCRYEAILVTAAVAAACAVVLPRARWLRTVALVALPAAYVFLLWLFASYLIVDDPFYWFKELNRIAKVSGTGASLYHAAGATPGYIAGVTLGFIALFAALLLALVPLCLRRGWRASLERCGLLVPGLVFPANMAYQLLRQSAPLAARYFYPCWIVGVAAALALAGDRAPGRAAAVNVRRSLMVVAAFATAAIQLFAFADRRVSNVENEGVLFAPVLGRRAPSPPDAAGWDAPYRPWRSMFRVADPLLAGGDRLMLDTDSAPQATLFSRHPDRLIIPEDRDFEQILAAPDGRVDLIALPTAAGQRGSRYYAAIAAVVAGRSARGHWVTLGSYEAITLYRFVPN